MDKKKWHSTGDLGKYEIEDHLNKLDSLGVTPDEIKLTRGGHGTKIYFYAYGSVAKSMNE